MRTARAGAGLPYRPDWDALIAAGVATDLATTPQYDGDGNLRWHGSPPKGMSCSIDTSDRQLVAYVLAMGRAPATLYPPGSPGFEQWSYPRGAGKTRAAQLERASELATEPEGLAIAA